MIHGNYDLYTVISMCKRNNAHNNADNKWRKMSFSLGVE